MAHTPTPWYVVGLPWGTGVDIYTNDDPQGGRFIASVDPMGMIEEGQQEVHGTERDINADAEFIVRAVNCHDELVRLLEMALECRYSGEQPWIFPARELLDKLEGSDGHA